MNSGIHFALPEPGRRTVSVLFARRHESAFTRDLARGAIRDAKRWKRIFGGLRTPVEPLEYGGVRFGRGE